jgi:hypothetical protein
MGWADDDYSISAMEQKPNPFGSASPVLVFGVIFLVIGMVGFLPDWISVLSKFLGGVLIFIGVILSIVTAMQR